MRSALLAGVALLSLAGSAFAADPRHRPALATAPVASHSPPVAPAEPEPNVRVACDQCAAAEVVGQLYRDILHVPFVVSQGVEADRRLVTVNIEGPLSTVRAATEAYLRGLGYVDVVSHGVHLVSPPPPPPPPPPPRKPPMTYSVYRPQWRDPSELARMLSGLFPDGRFGAGGGTSSAPLPVGGGPGGAGNVASAGPAVGSGGAPEAAPASVSTAGGSAADALVFYGTYADQARLRKVLPEVDVPEAEVMVKAAVFEVDTTQADGSAFNLAVSVLHGSLSAGLGSSASVGNLAASAVAGAATGGAAPLVGNFLSFSDKNFSAVVQALSTDQRFHLVTAPSVRARSGSTTDFTVGQQVPVLGSVAYYGGQGSTGPVQSVQYRSSGVILDVRPVVRGRVIDLDLHQEVSSFVQTTTGVNDTPTLQQREVSTALSVGPGDVICLGGLTQVNDGKSKDGLPGFLSFIGSRQTTHTRTDLLLVLQVDRLDAADGSPTPDELRARAAYPLPPGVPAIGGPR